MIAGQEGFIAAGTEGSYYRLTRFLSLLRLSIDDAMPRCRTSTLAGIRVGDARATIRFWRSPSGRTEHEVLHSDGKLRIHRAPARSSGVDGLSSLLAAMAAAN